MPRHSADADADAVPACQLLIYPWLDMSLQAPSVERFAEGFGLSRAELRRYLDLWLGIRRHAGLIHGFVEFLGLSAAARDAVDELGLAARRMLTAPTTN